MLSYRSCQIIIIGLLVMVFGSSSSSSKPLDTLWNAFPNKLLFSETPELGYKWRGGLQMRLAFTTFKIDTATIALPFPILDLYWNFGNILTADIFYTGYPKMTINRDTVMHDSTMIGDNFFIFALKSRPYAHTWGPLTYKAGAGLKYYRATATLKNTADESFVYDKKDQAVSLFLTQSLLAFKFNYVNLYSSMSLRRKNQGGETKIYPTFYFVPGYKIYWGKRKWCSLGIEYYKMNPIQFPMKLVQYLGSESGFEVENYSQNFYDFLFYGFTFSNRKIHAEISMGSHWSFVGPKFVLIGFGFNF